MPCVKFLALNFAGLVKKRKNSISQHCFVSYRSCKETELFDIPLLKLAMHQVV